MNRSTELLILKKAFTLIELLVVVAVLALLASIVFSNLGGAREGARISNALSFQSQTHSLLGSDLVGWWNFNDPSDRYKDISGYGNNGSCTSCPTAVDGVPGTGGTAMEFDGVGDYIDTGNGDSLDITGEITISAWVKRNDYTNWAIIVAKGGGGEHTGYKLREDDSGRFMFLIYTESGVKQAIFDVISSNNEWHYVVGVYNNQNIKVYFDEIEKIGNIATDNIDSNNNSVRIGSDDSISGRYFNGLIDDVRIYSRALTAGEIKGLYAQTKYKYITKE